MPKSKIKAYLFDWGDTLMIDYPNQQGKMCDWPKVSATLNAQTVLKYLAQKALIYIATGAEDSDVQDITRAFERVGLDGFINGYFCQNNTGVAKGSSDFLIKILDKLELKPHQVMMVGDSYQKDILPANELGIKTAFLNDTSTVDVNAESACTEYVQADFILSDLMQLTTL